MSAVIAKVEEEAKATENASVKKPPFKVSPLYEGDTTVDLTDPFYSEENMRRIAEAGRRIREGRFVVKTIEELEAMER